MEVFVPELNKFVTAPDDITGEELRAALQQPIDDATITTAEGIGRAAVRGVVGIGKAATTLGEVVTGGAEPFRQASEKLSQVEQAYAPAPIEQQSVLKKFQDDGLLEAAKLAATPSRLLPQLTEAGVSLLPSVLAAFATGGTSAALGATPKVAQFVGLIGGGLAGGALEGAQTYQQVLEQGGTESSARNAYLEMTAASAGLNAVSLGGMFAPLAKGGGLAKLGRALLSGSVEGVTEALEEPAEAAILSSEGQPVDWKQVAQRMVDVAIPSALLGGGVAATEAQLVPGEKPALDRQRNALVGKLIEMQEGVEKGDITYEQAIETLRTVPGVPLTELDQKVLTEFARTRKGTPERVFDLFAERGGSVSKQDVRFVAGLMRMKDTKASKVFTDETKVEHQLRTRGLQIEGETFESYFTGDKLEKLGVLMPGASKEKVAFTAALIEHMGRNVLTGTNMTPAQLFDASLASITTADTQSAKAMQQHLLGQVWRSRMYDYFEQALAGRESVTADELQQVVKKAERTKPPGFTPTEQRLVFGDLPLEAIVEQLTAGEQQVPTAVTLPMLKDAIGQLRVEEKWLDETNGAIVSYPSYNLKGPREDYFELLLSFPNYPADFTEDHFRQVAPEMKNIFAHVRGQIREVNGKRTLYLDEIQSDWLNKTSKGRKYNTPLPVEMPLRNSWHAIALRRMLRFAADMDVDAIAMATGAIQNVRNNVMTQFDAVRWIPGKGELWAAPRGTGKRLILLATDVKDVRRLEDYVGDALAERLLAQPEKVNKSKFTIGPLQRLAFLRIAQSKTVALRQAMDEDEELRNVADKFSNWEGRFTPEIVIPRVEFSPYALSLIRPYTEEISGYQGGIRNENGEVVSIGYGIEEAKVLEQLRLSLSRLNGALKTGVQPYSRIGEPVPVPVLYYTQEAIEAMIPNLSAREADILDVFTDTPEEGMTLEASLPPEVLTPNMRQYGTPVTRYQITLYDEEGREATTFTAEDPFAARALAQEEFANREAEIKANTSYYNDEQFEMKSGVEKIYDDILTKQLEKESGLKVERYGGATSTSIRPKVEIRRRQTLGFHFSESGKEQIRQLADNKVPGARSLFNSLAYDLSLPEELLDIAESDLANQYSESYGTFIVHDVFENGEQRSSFWGPNAETDANEEANYLRNGEPGSVRFSPDTKVHVMPLTPEFKKSMKGKLLHLFQAAGAKGEIEPTEIGGKIKYIIRALGASDFSTSLHEFTHFFVLTAQGKFKELIAEQAKADPSKWSVEQHERFAVGFESWLLNGEPKGGKYSKVFSLVKKEMQRVYHGVLKDDIPMSDEFRLSYELLLYGPDVLQEKSTLSAAVIDSLIKYGLPARVARGELGEKKKKEKKAATKNAFVKKQVEAQPAPEPTPEEVEARAAEIIEKITGEPAPPTLQQKDYPRVPLTPRMAETPDWMSDEVWTWWLAGKIGDSEAVDTSLFGGEYGPTWKRKIPEGEEFTRKFNMIPSLRRELIALRDSLRAKGVDVKEPRTGDEVANLKGAALVKEITDSARFAMERSQITWEDFSYLSNMAERGEFKSFSDYWYEINGLGPNTKPVWPEDPLNRPPEKRVPTKETPAKGKLRPAEDLERRGFFEDSTSLRPQKPLQQKAYRRVSPETVPWEGFYRDLTHQSAKLVNDRPAILAILNRAEAGGKIAPDEFAALQDINIAIATVEAMGEKAGANIEEMAALYSDIGTRVQQVARRSASYFGLMLNIQGRAVAMENMMRGLAEVGDKMSSADLRLLQAAIEAQNFTLAQNIIDRQGWPDKTRSIVMSLFYSGSLWNPGTQIGNPIWNTIWGAYLYGVHTPIRNSIDRVASVLWPGYTRQHYGGEYMRTLATLMSPRTWGKAARDYKRAIADPTGLAVQDILTKWDEDANFDAAHTALEGAIGRVPMRAITFSLANLKAQDLFFKAIAEDVYMRQQLANWQKAKAAGPAEANTWLLRFVKQNLGTIRVPRTMVQNTFVTIAGTKVSLDRAGFRFADTGSRADMGKKRAHDADILSEPEEWFTAALLNGKAIFAEHSTFQDASGPFVQAFSKMLHSPALLGLGRVFVPYVHTLATVAKRGMELTPGLGIPAGVVNKLHPTEIVSKQIEGLALALGVYSLMQIGKITGAPPDDPAEREAFYRSGKLPYAVNIHGMWFDYSRMDPFGLPLGMMTTLWNEYESILKDNSNPALQQKTLLDHMVRISVAARNYFIESQWMRGFASMLTGDEFDIKRQVMYSSTSLVPFSGFWRSMNNAYEAGQTGQVALRDRTFMELFGQTLPTPVLQALLSNGVITESPARLDAFGQPKGRNSSFFKEWIPYRYQAQISDPVENEFQALGLYPGMPGRIVTVDKRKGRVRMPDAAYDEYLLAYGTAAKERLTHLMSRPSYSSMRKEVKIKLVEDALESVRSRELKRIKLRIRRGEFGE